MPPAAAAPPPPCYPLTQPCRRWSTKNNFLTGITLPAWLRLLRRYGRLVDWRLYWQRVLFLSLMALFNSLLGLVDWWLYGEAVKLQRLHEQPIIVLGHPRTGARRWRCSFRSLGCSRSHRHKP